MGHTLVRHPKVRGERYDFVFNFINLVHGCGQCTRAILQPKYVIYSRMGSSGKRRGRETLYYKYIHMRRRVFDL